MRCITCTTSTHGPVHTKSLARTHARTRGVGVRERHLLGVVVDDEVLRELRQVHHAERGPEQELRDEVPVGDGVEAVKRDGGEAQLLRQEGAVDACGEERERGGVVSVVRMNRAA